MKIEVNCPYCDGKASLKVESKQISYKTEPHTITAHYYQCEKCLEEFTTTETDSMTMAQVIK